MRIIRFLDDTGRDRHGARQPDGSTTLLEGDILGSYADTGKAVEVARLLAPVAPPDILCLGQNYACHAAESGKEPAAYPVIFMKNSTTIQNPGDPIEIPRRLESNEVDYEGELGVIIGKTCKNVSAADAFGVILGYTCLNDVSARDWQSRKGGGQFCRGKSFSTFAPIGPCIVTTDEIPDPNALRIQTILNGDVMQDANTDDMIFNVPTLIEFLSGSTEIAAGTVIATGTPEGVGVHRKPPVFLKAGDSVTVDIENIGTLTNPVIDEPV